MHKHIEEFPEEFVEEFVGYAQAGELMGWFVARRLDDKVPAAVRRPRLGEESGCAE